MQDVTNSSYRVTADELRQFIERFERLEVEKKILQISRKRSWRSHEGYDIEFCAKS